MFEKVNPSHPDKIADRIAGAIVDLAYRDVENPRIAVEVLLGHGKCHIIVESSELLDNDEIRAIVKRIADIDDVEF
jgi:S-adenosylmethionine synthetase